ncbi:hypothetical protein SLEP1_g58181 [Rubroshorea leprosula]|uniref:Retrotransposon gag domain-containing protein n=1 Tax=Rubroshorea leprosula TaxID=152421 RepID=A0AAV5MS37_9ROSI|nr:hypothetical protein SLEP1_g58181 [Rubroshorea leprosula]
MGARMEMLEGDHNPADIPEGSLEDETVDGRDDDPVHEAGTANQVHMAEKRKVIFVKLKLKGAALQWWKRVEEQRSRQGKPKISTWEHMKAKMRKQFLPGDYSMELYENFYMLKQNRMSVEEYTSEFNNLSYRIGLNETGEQSKSRYLAGLNQSIRDEIGIVRLYNLEDAQQYALMAEKRVNRYGARRPIDTSKPIYDDNYYEEDGEVDVFPVQGESLVIRRVMTTTKEEGQDWRSHSLREDDQEKKSLADSNAEKFEAKSQEAGIIYAVLNKLLGKEQKAENSMQPNENLQPLEEIKGSKNKELPKGMLSMLNIQHDFDFVTSLTNLPT